EESVHARLAQPGLQLSGPSREKDVGSAALLQGSRRLLRQLLVGGVCTADHRHRAAALREGLRSLRTGEVAGLAHRLDAAGGEQIADPGGAGVVLGELAEVRQEGARASPSLVQVGIAGVAEALEGLPQASSPQRLDGRLRTTRALGARRAGRKFLAQVGKLA